MFSYVFQCFLTFSNVTYSHSHSLSLSHSFNLSLNHSWHAEQLLFSSLWSKLTLTLSHSHSFSLSHSFNLSFNHSRHAEQVLFSSLCWKLTVCSRKLQCFFFDSHHSTTLSCDSWVHRAGSQLKIYMKTKQMKVLDLLAESVHVSSRRTGRIRWYTCGLTCRLCE